jgi:hypothetical protein
LVFSQRLLTRSKSFFKVYNFIFCRRARPYGVCPSQNLSRALAPTPRCNPSAASSVIIIRRIVKTAIPLNTEAISVKIRKVRTCPFCRVKFAFCRLRTAVVLGVVFLPKAANGGAISGNFQKIKTNNQRKNEPGESRILGLSKPKNP